MRHTTHQCPSVLSMCFARNLFSRVAEYEDVVLGFQNNLVERLRRFLSWFDFDSELTEESGEDQPHLHCRKLLPDTSSRTRRERGVAECTSLARTGVGVGALGHEAVGVEGGSTGEDGVVVVLEDVERHEEISLAEGATTQLLAVGDDLSHCAGSRWNHAERFFDDREEVWHLVDVFRGGPQPLPENLVNFVLEFGRDAIVEQNIAECP
mmetsp:Transcript_53396/g.115926  ORF Transcript_53396/g.115926 Transcript_53396/m.115926 type:complete len:209 (-) Transcript_53396:909-1535(-)